MNLLKERWDVNKQLNKKGDKTTDKLKMTSEGIKKESLERIFIQIITLIGKGKIICLSQFI